MKYEIRAILADPILQVGTSNTVNLFNRLTQILLECRVSNALVSVIAQWVWKAGTVGQDMRRDHLLLVIAFTEGHIVI